MLEFYELIRIDEDVEFCYYITNNKNYKGKIKIARDKVDNFESAVKNGMLDSDKWNMRIV